MKKLFSVAVCVAMIGWAGMANAAPFSPDFSDYPNYTPTQDDLDATASAWFNTNYGITFDHMYMYTDSRDTFDGIGISNGWISQNYQPNTTGWVFFTDTTDFVTIDWTNVNSTSAVFSFYDSTNTLLNSYTTPTSGSYTVRFDATAIRSLTITTTGGYIGVSGLTYNYDGVTDGVNNDTTAPVPEPTTMLLFGTGLAGLAAVGRRRKVSKA